MRLHLVTVPYRYDEADEGLGAGPVALIEAGVVDRLGALGHDMVATVEARLDPNEREEGRTAVNIGRLGSRTAELVAASRRDGAGGLVLAGDDTASIGVVSGLQRAHGAGTPIGVVWLDAHGDFNTPETSYSGILAGMPLAILAGLAGPLWRGAAGLAAPIPTDRIAIAGTRELDKNEETLLRSTDVRVVTATELLANTAFDRVIERLAASCALLYLHVDLDILDPHLVPSNSTPSPGGLSVEQVAAAMGTVFATGLVAVMSVAGLNPGAGARGTRSIKTTLELLETALAGWMQTPPMPDSLI
jgi:arginase